MSLPDSRGNKRRFLYFMSLGFGLPTRREVFYNFDLETVINFLVSIQVVHGT